MKMKKFEHKRVTGDDLVKLTEEERRRGECHNMSLLDRWILGVNKLGQEGWELIFFEESGFDYDFYLKREIEDRNFGK